MLSVSPDKRVPLGWGSGAQNKRNGDRVSKAVSRHLERPTKVLRGVVLITTPANASQMGGVIAAADTRASCAGLVACPSARKVTPIHSHLVVTSSGSGADCVLWERVLAREIRLYQLRHGRRLSVSGAGKLLALMLHPFKGTEVCVAATLCGWDEGDEVVCYVCSDGLRLNGELISVGSGSPYAYSVLDAGWRWSMTVNEAVALAREAVYRATHRDAYSGNNVDLFHITARGWKCRRREDLKEEYYKENRRGKEMMREYLNINSMKRHTLKTLIFRSFELLGL
uniref:proteasome endopeptidase complex n=1 Tax=Electrophorus electricus TaxID=8005 RepID=A0AAY5EQU9_ELEEL